VTPYCASHRVVIVACAQSRSGRPICLSSRQRLAQTTRREIKRRARSFLCPLRRLPRLLPCLHLFSMPPKVARPHASMSHSMPLPSHPRDTPQSTSSAGRKRCSDSKRDEEADAAEPLKKHKVKVGARASIACITCRKRKVRCSGEWPSCVFCATRSLSCVYEGHPGEFGGPTCG
jgi:hypothetical protein